MPGDQTMPTQAASADGAPVAGNSTRKPHTRRRAIGTGLARACLALILVVGVLTSATPFGRAAARGLMLLWPVLSASEPPLYDDLGEGVRHTSLTITSNTGPVYLDVYAPTQAKPLLPGSRGAMLFIPGVGDNRTISQLVNLDESLARNGVVVMNMTTTALIDYDLSPADSDAVVRAFQRLAAWPGVDPKRVGIVGFSGGAPLACLAAVDARIRDQVAYILDFGGYYNVVDVLRDFGRRAITLDGKSQRWVPTAVPLTVLSNVLAHRLPEPDASELQAAFTFDNPTPLTDEERATLSPEGQAAYDLLSGDAPDKVDGDIATITAAGGDLLAALSPSSVVDQIRAPIYLLHDHGDTSLPVSEARDFAAALAKLHHPHDYVEVTIFDHTEVRSGLPIGEIVHDGSALARLLYELLLHAS